ncbi:hypothetical protein SDJN03_17323, partial [Cucurbita argyrosperma subsp. sororia]
MAVVAQIASNDPISQLKIDGCLICPSKWIQIPDVSEVCVQNIAKFAVEDYNLVHKESFKYKSIKCGWFMELKGEDLAYRLHIEVKDCLGRIFELNVVVSEKKTCAEKIRKLESAKLIKKN